MYLYHKIFGWLRVWWPISDILLPKLSTPRRLYTDFTTISQRLHSNTPQPLNNFLKQLWSGCGVGVESLWSRCRVGVEWTALEKVSMSLMGHNIWVVAHGYDSIYVESKNCMSFPWRIRDACIIDSFRRHEAAQPLERLWSAVLHTALGGRLSGNWRWSSNRWTDWPRCLTLRATEPPATRISWASSSQRQTYRRVLRTADAARPRTAATTTDWTSRTRLLACEWSSFSSVRCFSRRLNHDVTRELSADVPTSSQHLLNVAI